MNTEPGNIDHRRLDALRTGRGPIPEHIIDEFVAGRLSRRDFLRRATMVGLGLPVAGAILEACGSSSSGTTTTTTATAPTGKAGATIRAGMIVPSGAINPITIDDAGGLEQLDQVGEWLVFTDQQLNYQPWLATSWKPNATGSVWTFKIRQGVKFNNGTPMTVDDVVYSFKSQSDPKSSANALSVFGGTLDPAGVVKVDDQTVAFHLDAPDGSFLDAVSQDNYNMIIVPNNYDFADYQKDFIGTGRFMKASYTPSVGATYVRNPHYWGKAALPKELQVTYYASEAAQTAALQAGDIDCNDGFSVSGSPQLLGGAYNIISLKGSLHRELSLNNAIPPFNNKYVRQAIAYSLDRPAIVNALFKGYAVVGNDSPFAPIFRSTNTSVPQRTQNLALAKQLLAKGGVPNGFKTPLLTETTEEMPRYAQIIASSAKALNVDISLTIESPTKYYGDAVFGKSDWLDGEMSLVDYGSRGVPNLFLEAPLQSYNAKTGQGSWNAAHFANAAYDKLSKEFVAAVDLSTQRNLAGQIERLLLDETPIIYSYFYDLIIATQKDISGVYPTQLGLFYWNATKS
jgi:peptide/nickel transport system substrate-binding protein